MANTALSSFVFVKKKYSKKKMSKIFKKYFEIFGFRMDHGQIGSRTKYQRQKGWTQKSD